MFPYKLIHGHLTKVVFTNVRFRIDVRYGVAAASDVVSGLWLHAEFKASNEDLTNEESFMYVRPSGECGDV